MSLNHQELKEAIELVCTEKGLEIGEVKKSIETAIAGAYRKEFGQRESAYQAEFDLNTGKYNVYQVMFVVDDVVNPSQQVSVIDARLTDPNAVEGDVLKTPLQTDQNLEFGRIASQIAKQVLAQSIQNVRHGKILQQFKDKVGDVVSVEVDYFHKGGYYVKLGQTNGYIARENLLPSDRFKPGISIKAYIASITEDIHGNAKILLTRTDSNFVKAIMAQEIPEIAAGVVTVDKIAREPGVRSKVLVSAQEGEDIDPVGTVLGKKNMRIINIMRQISNTMQEKIDIIENQPDDLDLMVMDALEPAQIEKVVLHPEEKKAEVHCYKDEAALAVGKWGVNIRLAQELLDLELSIVTIDEPETSSSVPSVHQSDINLDDDALSIIL